MTHSDPTTHRPSRVGRALAIACVLGLATALLPAAANAATSPTLTIASLTTNAASGTVDTNFVFTVTTNVAANVVQFTTDDPNSGVIYITKKGDTNAPGSTVNLANKVWTFKTLLKPGTRVLTFTAYDANTLPSPSKTLTIPVKGMLLVGLGESFAVGLGVGSYQNDGTNCYRSAYAYTRLLDADTSLAVPLVVPGNGVIDGFQACSGAKIPNILDTARVDTDPVINSKIPEFSVDVQRLIGNYPTLVVMSLGGNDVNYEEYMMCLATVSGTKADSVCQAQIQKFLTPGTTGTELFSNILRDSLADLYNKMLDAKPNIKILVVNYPMMVKNEPGVNVCGLVLAGTKGRLYNLEMSLNSKIAEAVALSAAKPGHAGRVFLADVNAPGSPWIGHDLCSANPYFNKAFFAKHGPYHPNKEGHQAYETVIKNWIAGHVAQLTK